MKTNKQHSDLWPSDGHEHHEISRDSIYENKKIRAFLEGNTITLLVASKGMGKTLLMRVKKKLAVDSREGITIIPSTDTEFDEPKLHGTYPLTGFSDILLWKDLWSLSIILSILTHVAVDFSDNDNIAFLSKKLTSLSLGEEFEKEILNEIRNNIAYLPSYYLAKLLGSFSEGELHKLRLKMNVVDELSDMYIKSAIVVFIDAFDQTLTETFPGNLEAWKNGQLGLAKAAHTLHTKNHHVKVLATIRQEAWAGFIDDDREVIRGKALILEHTETDLKNLFLKAVLRYTQHQTLEEWLGIKTIDNICCNEKEDIFHYIFRHSTGSARSLMQFGKAIDELDLVNMTEKNRTLEIRETVDFVAAEKTIADYLAGQKRIFMKTLKDEQRLRALFHLIPSNVLTAHALESINKKFCSLIKIPEDSSHPFCELYNSGLLGKVRLDSASGGHYQYFKRPFEFDWFHKEILQRNATYLIHPGLMSHIAKETELKINRINAVGVGREWKIKSGRNGVPKVFISYSFIDTLHLEPIIEALQYELDLKFPSDIWLDKWKIIPGMDIHQSVEKGVEDADMVVLFASPSSLASGWVDKEWRTKHNTEITTQDICLVVALLNKTKPENLPPFLKGKRAVRCNTADSAKELANAIAYHVDVSLKKKFPSMV